ncbi:MAG: hypothetical protein E4H19_04365 [Chromatiales bacterium]|nr:MAG: hypothetical protein E4H19_04365 [Chromatiales bacterium]
MQQRTQHEFSADDNETLIGLAEGLGRFSMMTGVVGLALAGLGIAALVTGGYGSVMTGPSLIVLGLVAMVGGGLFLRPRGSLTWITSSRGGDVTKLMDALHFLDSAHGVFRVLIAAFVLARLASFVLTRLG